MSYLSFINLPLSIVETHPHAFLGFNRKEEREEFWEEIVHSVSIQVFDFLQEKYDFCLCTPNSSVESTNIEMISQNFQPAHDQKIKITHKSKLMEKIRNLSSLLVVNTNESQALKNGSRTSYPDCTCYLNPIDFVSNNKQVGIILRKLASPQTKESSQMVLTSIDKKYNSLEGSYLQEMIEGMKNFSFIFGVNKRETIDVATMHRREVAINQLAVEKLCKFSLQAGMEKTILVSEIEEAKKGGYLLSETILQL